MGRRLTFVRRAGHAGTLLAATLGAAVTSWGDEPTAPATAPAVEPTNSVASKPGVGFPHPMIVEVLYAVPPGIEGDANGDGVRQVAGDEFIELVNPHNRPIQLMGYTLVDESQGAKNRVRFTFPPVELAPGGVVVVFNGFGCSWEGEIGDQTRAPSKGNSRASGARVFSMRVSGSRTAFNNTGDSVTLLTPAAKPVQRVRWGESGTPAPLEDEGVLDELVPESTRCSVQRLGVKPGDAWLSHTDFGGKAFSPGVYDLDIAPAPQSATPTPTTEPDTERPGATPPAPEAPVAPERAKPSRTPKKPAEPSKKNGAR